MKSVLRVLEITGMGLVIAALLLWVGDWVVFAVRASHGNGYDTVQVQQFLTTSLKGNKQEYDYLGTATVTCARAVFPRAGAPPCWWQRRHLQEWE
jgi:hypothetical protein